MDNENTVYTDAVRRLTAGEPHRYYVVTLGCQQNEADSEKLRAMARDMGYLPAERAENASLIVVNTCAVRRHAEEKALSLVGTFKHIKTEHPEVIIGICGCMAAEPGTVRTIKQSFPYVSFTLEPNMLHRFPELVFGALSENRRTFVLGEDRGEIVEGVKPLRSVRHRAWVSVMYGCNNFCSYCIVPYVRGRERSRDSRAVLDECRGLIADGCREITLLGQNVNSYRSDTDFAGLVTKIAQLEGDFIIRFMTSHPKDVSDGLIEAMRRYPEKIAPCFHLPLQSGSDRILRAMNRKYTREHYLSTVKKLREAVPGIALTTDIIVAFPGETEEDFEETCRMVEEVGYDSLFSFIFSPREGTPAAKMENTIPKEEKTRRMTRLLDISKRISYEKNLPYEGRTVRVLADSDAREGGYLGRTPTGKLVRFSAKENPVGRFVNVRIEKATPYDLFGKMCK